MQNKEIEAIVDDFYTIAPKYRTKARLKEMLVKYNNSINKKTWKIN